VTPQGPLKEYSRCLSASDLFSRQPSSFHTTATQTGKRRRDVRGTRSLFLVVSKRHHIRGFTDDFLNLVTASGLLKVPCKRPFAHAPVLDRTLACRIVALHITAAPVRLTRYLAEVPTHIACHIDADVMAAPVVVVIHALAITSETGKCHTGLGTLL